MRGVAVHGAGMMPGGILLVLALALPSAASPDSASGTVIPLDSDRRLSLDSDRRLALNYVVAYAPNWARLAQCCECKDDIAAGDLRIGLRHAPTLEATKGQILSQSPSHPILVAFVWELTKETIHLPLGCLWEPPPILLSRPGLCTEPLHALPLPAHH